jgi:hypothetical protein
MPDDRSPGPVSRSDLTTPACDHGSMNEVPAAPSRVEVETRLLDLIAGRIGRDEATNWAMQWIGSSDPDIDDEVVWRALNNLAGADAPSTDRQFLFDQPDFQAWLEELRRD